MTVSTTNNLKFFILMWMAWGFALKAWSANWIELQGSENPAVETIRLYGFVQPTWISSASGELPVGPFAGKKPVFNSVGPDFKSSSGFQLMRARLGARGWVHGAKGRANFNLLTEWGDNAITSSHHGPIVVDASLTLHRDSGWKIRIGQFKYPGSEEGMLPIFKHPFISYTNVTSQLLLERFFDEVGATAGSENAANGPIGAFRDQGIEVFYNFERMRKKHTAAIMVGNGNGIGRGDNNNDKDLYLFWASEGNRGEDAKWKWSLWSQWGHRSLSQTHYERRRSGVGVFLEKDRWLTGWEWIWGRGVIFDGTDGGARPGESDGVGGVASNNVLPEEEAQGGYLSIGYSIEQNWRGFFRYDIYERGLLLDSNFKRFQTLALSLEHLYSQNVRLVLNYEFRKAEAPRLANTHAANRILSEMKDRLSLQSVVYF